MNNLYKEICTHNIHARDYKSTTHHWITSLFCDYLGIPLSAY